MSYLVEPADRPVLDRIGVKLLADETVAGSVRIAYNTTMRAVGRQETTVPGLSAP